MSAERGSGRKSRQTEDQTECEARMHRCPENGAERCGAGQAGTGRDWAITHRLGHQEVHQPPGSRRGGRLAGQDGNSL